jgi:para-nitrobenzyl esterase
MTNAEIAAYLRAQTPETILSAYPETDSEGDPHRLLRAAAAVPRRRRAAERRGTAAFAAGDYHRVPVILGSNHDENKIFMFASSKYVRRFLGIPRLRDAEQLRPRGALPQPLLEGLRGRRARGRDAPRSGPSVYAYRFDWDEEPSILGADLGRMIGAAHFMEVPFVFGHFDVGPNSKLLFDEGNAPARLALSEQMQSYWGEFAWTGAPGSGRDGRQPAWTAWDPSQTTASKYIVFDTAAGGGIRMAHETESTSAIIAELSGDASFDGAARCAMLAEWTRDVPTVVARAQSLGCQGPEIASGN